MGLQLQSSAELPRLGGFPVAATPHSSTFPSWLLKRPMVERMGNQPLGF